MASEDRPVVVSEGKFLRFMKKGHWEYVSRKGVTGIVAIIPITRDGKLVLVEQYRAAVDARVIEIPAGLAGDGRYRHETLEAAARRELLEETGYEANTITYIAGGTASAGISDELISLFLATELNKTGPGLGDGDEQISVHEVPIEDVTSWLNQQAANGAMVDLKVYSALYFAKPNA